MINLTLPLPPSANSYQPHTNRGGRCVRYFSSKAKAFKNEVYVAVLENKCALKLDGRLRVEVIINPRDKRKIDLDNRIKPLLDALEDANCFVNDSQIDELNVKRGCIVKGGQAVVEVTLLS